MDDFETVIQTCGDDAMGAYYHAAEALFVLGETAAGCTYLRTALRDAESEAFSKQIRYSRRRSVGHERTSARARAPGLVTG